MTWVVVGAQEHPAMLWPAGRCRDAETWQWRQTLHRWSCRACGDPVEAANGHSGSISAGGIVVLRHGERIVIGESKLAAGTQLGHYRVERFLGEGGMGVVYLADDLRHERKVAIKIVHRDRLAEPDVAERFRRESSNQAQVNHPNLLPLLDSGQEDEIVYFVTPFQSAGDLYALLERRRLTLSQVAHIMRQVADALSVVHSADIVHRDVKPGNILVAHEDDLSVFLADFGLSLRISDARLTEAGAITGTLPYMAPEQFTGGPVTPATDVFALAVTTHEVVTGQHRCTANCAASPDAAAVCEIVRHGMAEDPKRRYGSAREFAAALTAAVDPASALPLTPDGFGSGPFGSLDIPVVSAPALAAAAMAASATSSEAAAASTGSTPALAPTHPQCPNSPEGPSNSQGLSGAEDPAPSRSPGRGERGRRRPRRTLYLLVLLATVVSALAGITVALALTTAARPVGRTSPSVPATLPSTQRSTTAIPPATAPPSTIPSAVPTPATQKPAPSPTVSVAQVSASASPTTVMTEQSTTPPPMTPAASDTGPPTPGPAVVQGAPAGSVEMIVCAQSATIRDRPAALSAGAVPVGPVVWGDHFLAFPGSDEHWVQGFAYTLNANGWVERKWLARSCPT